MTFYGAMVDSMLQIGSIVDVLVASSYEPIHFAVSSNPTCLGIRSEPLDYWLKHFDHLSATPALRRMLATAWAAWDVARQAGPYDVIETTDFGLLHVPHALRPLAPTVVQAHGSWGQIGLHERTVGQEIDQNLALALEVEAMRNMAGRHVSNLITAKWWEHQGVNKFTIIRPCWNPLSVVHVGNDVDPVIRVFGRIQAWKGPSVAATAWATAPELPDIEWYGRDVATNSRGGSTDATLRGAHPGIWGARIRPSTILPPAEVTRLQSRALLNLVPSTWDVFNFTAAEAMASGRPVVCSDKAGASELIEDGRTGFVYDGASPDALVEAVRRALALGPEQLARIGTDGRESVLDALDPERQALAHLAAYEAAIVAPCQTSLTIPSWFREIAMPREPVTRIGHHLDQHPLRELAAHVLDRTLRKVKLKA